MAIKAEELRIGNWVQTGGYQNKITSLGEVACHTTGRGRKVLHTYEFVHGIPLTPEILEKAGFVRVGRYAIGAGGYHVYKNGKVEFLKPNPNEDEYHLIFFETKIQYVHQLQNLYFALTGTELTITL